MKKSAKIPLYPLKSLIKKLIKSHFDKNNSTLIGTI